MCLFMRECVQVGNWAGGYMCVWLYEDMQVCRYVGRMLGYGCMGVQECGYGYAGRWVCGLMEI